MATPAPPRLTRAGAQAQTRGKLIETAARVFAERGYGGATLDQIATEAGFTIGAIYSNFDNKQGLFLAVLEEHVGGRIEEFANTLDLAESDSAGLADAATDTMRHLEDDATWFPLFVEFWSEATRDPLVRDKFAANQQRTRRRLEQIIKQRAARAGRPLPLPAPDLAILIKAISNGIAMEQLSTPGEIPDDLLARSVQALFGDEPG